jgi:hypothetical protein
MEPCEKEGGLAGTLRSWKPPSLFRQRLLGELVAFRIPGGMRKSPQIIAVSMPEHARRAEPIGLGEDRNRPAVGYRRRPFSM